jgi:hypothetical protein
MRDPLREDEENALTSNTSSERRCYAPEQRLYEGIRPITLLGAPPAERAEETGVAESTLHRTAHFFNYHC